MKFKLGKSIYFKSKIKLKNRKINVRIPLNIMTMILFSIPAFIAFKYGFKWEGVSFVILIVMAYFIMKGTIGFTITLEKQE